VAARLASVHNDGALAAQRSPRPEIEPRFLRQPPPPYNISGEGALTRDLSEMRARATVPTFIRGTPDRATPSVSATSRDAAHGP